MSTPAGQTLEREHLDDLFEALHRRGYTVVGPRLQAQALVYGELSSSADLPAGWTDEQEAGHYRVRRREDDALFGYNVGPHSWKRYQLPAERRLWSARRDENGGLGDIEQAPAQSAALRLPGRALLRAARDGDPRSRAPRRKPARPGRARRARGRLHRRRAVHPGRQHLLLQLDGHGPRPRRPGSTSRSRR